MKFQEIERVDDGEVVHVMFNEINDAIYLAATYSFLCLDSLVPSFKNWYARDNFFDKLQLGCAVSLVTYNTKNRYRCL